MLHTFSIRVFHFFLMTQICNSANTKWNVAIIIRYIFLIYKPLFLVPYLFYYSIVKLYNASFIVMNIYVTQNRIAWNNNIFRILYIIIIQIWFPANKKYQIIIMGWFIYKSMTVIVIFFLKTWKPWSMLLVVGCWWYGFLLFSVTFIYFTAILAYYITSF